MAQVRIGEHELHYVRRRPPARPDAPPLLLIQGLSGHSGHWGEPFLRALERDFDVVAYDHRGSGRSSRHRGSFSIADLAADATALLDALAIARAHLVGISMGGMVAQQLALRHPERVRTLVLGCTSAGGPASATTPVAVLARLTEAYLSGDPQRILRAGWEANVSARFAADEASFALYARAVADRPASFALVADQLAAVARHDTSARLGEISAPTLVLHGTEDLMLPTRNAPVLAARIPGARLELLPGLGHLFFWEEPERTAALVREWAGVGAPAARSS